MHFLRKSEVSSWRTSPGRPYAAVVVRYEKIGRTGRRLIIEEIQICKADTEFQPLPLDVEVVSEEGERVLPSRSKHFWVSTESFDPYHLVTDAPCMPVPDIERSSDEEFGA